MTKTRRNTQKTPHKNKKRNKSERKAEREKKSLNGKRKKNNKIIRLMPLLYG